MKILTTITAITLAGLFSLNTNAGSLTKYDYESYVNSGAWPTDTSTSQSFRSIAEVQDSLEQSPTAAGYQGRTISVDLLGEDIYQQ